MVSKRLNSSTFQCFEDHKLDQQSLRIYLHFISKKYIGSLYLFCISGPAFVFIVMPTIGKGNQHMLKGRFSSHMNRQKSNRRKKSPHKRHPELKYTSGFSLVLTVKAEKALERCLSVGKQ